MELSTIIIIVAVLILIGAAITFYYLKNRNTRELFQQAYEMSKQVPKQKKNSLLLLIFKETLSASKDKKKQSSLPQKFNNPKYLNLQLIQMTNALKNPSGIQDKKMKSALKLLKQYQAWEKNQKNEARNKTESKAS